MKDKEGNIVAAFITGAFSILAALVGGAFLLVQTGYLDGEVTITQPTATPLVQVQATLTVRAIEASSTVTSIELIYERAKGNIKLGRLDDALTDLEIVFGTDPNYKDVQALLGQVQNSLGKKEGTRVNTSSCKYVGNSDVETFINLIQKEEEIALNEEIDELYSIYLDTAFIRNAREDEVWNDFHEKYFLSFEKEKILSLVHYDFEVVGNTGVKAWVTNATIGEVLIEATGEKRSFKSDPASDHWTFAKDDKGCWKIASLEFDAAGERFP